MQERDEFDEATGEAIRPNDPAKSGVRRRHMRPVDPGLSEAETREVDEGSLELREERLVAEKERRLAGEVQIHKEIEEVPGRLEVEVLREEVQVEHVPIGRFVSEKSGPREEGDVMIVPVYEEQLAVVKRLVLKEELHIRRVQTRETQLHEDTLRRERAVIEDSDDTGRVRELYPTDDDEEGREKGGFMENLGRRLLS